MENIQESGQTKTCPRCKLTLPLSGFSKCRTKKDGLQVYCKPCHRAGVLAWQKKYVDRVNQKNALWKDKNRDKVLSWNAAYREEHRKETRAYGTKYMRKKREAMLPEERRQYYRRLDLWKKYRLRVEEYDALLASQDGTCAICKTREFGDRNPHVDHNHETGENRGILCQHCNPLLHKLEAFPGWIEAAAEYLKKYAMASQS